MMAVRTSGILKSIRLQNLILLLVCTIVSAGFAFAENHVRGRSELESRNEFRREIRERRLRLKRARERREIARQREMRERRLRLERARERREITRRHEMRARSERARWQRELRANWERERRARLNERRQAFLRRPAA